MLNIEDLHVLKHIGLIFHTIPHSCQISVHMVVSNMVGFGGLGVGEGLSLWLEVYKEVCPISAPLDITCWGERRKTRRIKVYAQTDHHTWTQ